MEHGVFEMWERKNTPKQTWQLKIHHLKMFFQLNMRNLHCHLGFRERTFIKDQISFGHWCCLSSCHRHHIDGWFPLHQFMCFFSLPFNRRTRNIWKFRLLAFVANRVTPLLFPWSLSCLCPLSSWAYLQYYSIDGWKSPIEKGWYPIKSPWRSCLLKKNWTQTESSVGSLILIIWVLPKHWKTRWFFSRFINLIKVGPLVKKNDN